MFVLLLKAFVCDELSHCLQKTTTAEQQQQTNTNKTWIAWITSFASIYRNKIIHRVTYQTKKLDLVICTVQ